SRIAASSVSIGRRREKLEAQADCGSDGPVAGDYSWGFYAPGAVYAVESPYGCLERRYLAAAHAEKGHRAGAAGRAGPSGQPVPKLAFPGGQRRAERTGAG